MQGTETGKGSDGEPLLKNAKIVSEAYYDKATDTYKVKKKQK